MWSIQRRNQNFNFFLSHKLFLFFQFIFILWNPLFSAPIRAEENRISVAPEKISEGLSKGVTDLITGISDLLQAVNTDYLNKDILSNVVQASVLNSDRNLCALEEQNLDTVPQKLFEINELSEPMPGLKFGKNDFSENCKTFIDEKGNYGETGRAVLQSLQTVEGARECLMDRLSYSKICPNFPEFSQKQKEHFIVWMMASLGSVESTCRSYAVGDPVYGGDIAIGYFQLEGTTKRRKRSGRDPLYCRLDNDSEANTILKISTELSIIKGSEELSESQKDKELQAKFNSFMKNNKTKTLWQTFQVECATSILRDLHCKADEVNEMPYYDSYWGPKRKNNSSVIELMRTYPGCF